MLEGQPKLLFGLRKKLEKEAEDSKVELDPTVAPEKTNDPVRIYLREMGAVPLLTREGEVDIAKRIERGQLRALKALSRSPLVIHQILTIGDDLKRGLRSIKETVVFDEEEITEEILQDRVKESRAASTSCKSITNEPAGWPNGCRPPGTKESTPIQSLPMRLGREMVRISLIIRNLGLTQFRAQTPDGSSE